MDKWPWQNATTDKISMVKCYNRSVHGKMLQQQMKCPWQIATTDEISMAKLQQMKCPWQKATTDEMSMVKCYNKFTDSGMTMV